MNVDNFFRDAGLKVLAIAHLNQCEYSIMFYLLNCSVSGLDQLITTESELASLMAYQEPELRTALDSLAQRRLIHLHYSQGKSTINETTSVVLGIEYNIKKWLIKTEDETLSAKDAIIFPFRRKGEVNLQIIGDKDTNKEPEKTAWQRVYETYLRFGHSTDDDLENSEDLAKILVDTHPVDQVLFIIRHFGKRIPSLSLLASSWQHYQELFEQETQNIDLLDAKKKHLELDQSLRTRALALMHNEKMLANLSDEEKHVLNILVKHRHPRRQLFWAYQVRSRYPNLNLFFAENIDIMLPVTSTGHVIKRPTQDS
ncbi:MAG: hypothetical protein KBD78_07085 [Oligoflexales bacterium]|nr:hypothetical protein [Oligoflexales bacterium]